LQAANKITVIGIGFKPFDRKARDLISGSDVILASKRLLEVFKRYEEFEAVKNKVIVPDNINETFNFLRDNHETKKIVLIASGDPLFSGIGRRIVEEFGKSSVEIIPDLSNVQIAFSRIKESWNDAFLISLHGGPDPAKRRRLPYEIQDIPSLLERHNKIAILTDRENNPSEIARGLSLSPRLRRANSLSPMLYVCEKLGYEDEKITEGSPEEIAGKLFSGPNVVIILGLQPAVPGPKPSDSAFGLKEEEIAHSGGLITKDEVRAVTIHKLRLPQAGVLWDIGSGSGSISIEAARLFPRLKVFAVEKNKEQIANIRENRTRFQTSNVEVIEGLAPDALKELPLPDRVFIGGGSGQLAEIIPLIAKTMSSGIVVINAVKIETLDTTIYELKRAGFIMDISQISVSRIKAAGDGNFLSALNPVFIITGLKNSEGGEYL
jgi:precorrin-6Y C5,15-methyltransferase (decarboxylating)